MSADANVFLLPEYRIGPYRMSARPSLVEMTPQAPVRNDWDNNQVLIDANVSPARQLTLYVRNLIATMHYRAGLHNDVWEEEAYTQNVAAGFAELSQQRLFWTEFVALLQQELAPRAKWHAAALGHVHAPHPKRVVCKAHACVFRPMRPSDVAADRWYAWFDANPTPQRIELSPHMAGHNFCVVILHEVLHFIHEQWGLRTRKRVKAKQFTRVQGLALLDFWRNNPSFWTWWLALSAAACEAQ